MLEAEIETTVVLRTSHEAEYLKKKEKKSTEKELDETQETGFHKSKL